MTSLLCPACNRVICACPGNDAAPLPAAHRDELEMHVLRRRVEEDRARYLNSLRDLTIFVGATVMLEAQSS